MSRCRTLENYFRQCSVLVNCRDLAYMAATLANGGVHPLTRKRALPAEHVERVLSVMATCGMYDFAGSWLYEVGMPAKSGVGGGIIAVLPGSFGIGIFSPRLDEKGNSVRGIEACKQLSHDFSLHVFTCASDPRMALGRVYTGADAPSRRQPAAEIRAHLKENASRIKYLCLHGFLHVDGVEYVIRRMRDMAADSNSYILDMHHVAGISESAARLLNQARLGFGADNIALVYSRIHDNKAIVDPLRKVGQERRPGFPELRGQRPGGGVVREPADRDVAGNACAGAASGRLALVQGRARAADETGRSGDALQLFAKGEQIMVQGQENDTRIFFIETGQVSVLVPIENGGHQRIASLGPGMNFGEMVLLGNTTRSASVYADTEVKCRILESGDLDNISDHTPQLKIILLENLAKDIASNLRRATQWIAALA